MVGGVVAIIVKSVIIVQAKQYISSVILGDWMLTEYKLQYTKHATPKLVTDDGMVTEVNLLQP